VIVARLPLAVAIAVLAAPIASAQAPAVVPDTSFHPRAARPAFPSGTGPRAVLDAAHFNPENLVGFFAPIGELLRSDGFRVDRSAEPLDAGRLASVDVLVVANALPAATQEEADTLGSAFLPGEIEALLSWIEGGGGLLLFVDHRPFPRAAAALAERLGLEMLDGYALDYEVWDPVVFSRRRGTLRAHSVTDGRADDERVDSVATFYGHAFRAVDPAWRPLMVFGPEIESMQPGELWAIDDDTPRVPVGGWWQGAVRAMGLGRVIVFGETGMAVAQRVGPRGNPQGMNTRVGAQNAALLVNAVRWLAGL